MARLSPNSSTPPLPTKSSISICRKSQSFPKRTSISFFPSTTTRTPPSSTSPKYHRPNLELLPSIPKSPPVLTTPSSQISRTPVKNALHNCQTQTFTKTELIQKNIKTTVSTTNSKLPNTQVGSKPKTRILLTNTRKKIKKRKGFFLAKFKSISIKKSTQSSIKSQTKFSVFQLWHILFSWFRNSSGKQWRVSGGAL